MRLLGALSLATALLWQTASAYHEEYDGSGWVGDPKQAYPDYGYEPPPGYSPYPVTCVFEPEAQLQLYQCLMPGTAICRDGWTFGIDKKDGYVKLWKDGEVSRKRCLCFLATSHHNMYK